MTETLRALVERAIELLKHVNVLDCGAHHCRYCLAKSPHWEHTPSCPYAESQRLHTEAGELRRALSAVLATAQAAPPDPGWRDIASAPKGSWLDGPSDARLPDYIEPPRLLLLTPGGPCFGYADAYYSERGSGYDGGSFWVEQFSGERITPTHWLPPDVLPAPPVARPAERKE